MMSEINTKENSEIKTPESNKYKEIKPENGTTYSDSKQFWKERKFSLCSQETKLSWI